MSNRWSKRKPLALNVDLYYRDAEYRGCRTRNIGLGGMFIELEDVPVPPRGMVELVVRLDREGRERRHRFKGSVVHSSGRGFGMMFRDFSIADVRMLQQVL